MSDPVGYWLGEPISEMNREQLLQTIREMALTIEESRSHNRRVLAAWDAFRKARQP